MAVVKPANIMIVPRDGGGYRPVLTDFGLARHVNDSLGLTESGAVMGTPWYMSPEQTRGDVRAVDRRSDIYSLGATLFELIAGRPPFHSETTVDALIEGMVREPPLLSTQVMGLPKGLDLIVAKCLNKQPEQRYATALELADDLHRVLSHQPVRARRLGFLHRLRWRARHNRPAAAALVALVAILLCAAGYVGQSQVARMRQDRIARQQAELSRRLGQDIANLEAMARLAYAMPLHDTGRERAMVQARMVQIERELQAMGPLGDALSHYALGRGHLALHEWAQAARSLQRAQAGGIDDPELDYALGRVQGALYSEGLEAARKSGDASFFARRRGELMRELLGPALQNLERSRRGKAIGTAYAEGLLAYYSGRYDAALVHARRALIETPWAYEAQRLAGDVHAARGLEQKDRGDYVGAAQSLEEALRQYGEASEQGRSDYQVYEAIAEVVVRQMEIDGLRDQTHEQRLPQAIQAAERAVAADPVHSHGDAKKAFAYLFRNMQMESRGLGSEREREAVLQALLNAGMAAVMRHPDDEYAQEVLGSAYVCKARYRSQRGEGIRDDLALSREHLSRAVALNGQFPWAHNELGSSYMIEGDDLLARHQDPTMAYEGALAAFRRAVEVDGKYVNAYANGALVYSSLARWSAESGRSPAEWVGKTKEWAGKAAEIDRSMLLPMGSTIYAYIMQAQYEQDGGQDISATLNLATTLVDEASRRYGEHGVLAQHSAILRYLGSRQQSLQGKDPTPAIDSALMAVRRCQGLSREVDATCTAIAAQLYVQQAEWAHGQHVATAEWEGRAGTQALSALRAAGGDNDVRLSVAEVFWRLARLRRAKGVDVTSAVRQGRDALAAVLGRAPDWPRALAIQGGLSALWAAATLNAEEQGRARATALEILLRAERGNGQMRKAYRDAYSDAGWGAAMAAASHR